jgi:cell division protein FtsB
VAHPSAIARPTASSVTLTPYMGANVTLAIPGGDPLAAANAADVSAYARAAARPNIRWDRLGRVFLLAVLFVIMLMYVSPLTRWVTQKSTAKQDAAELRQLESTNTLLKSQIRSLQSPQALELRARGLGMVKQGERAFVIENLPR